MLPGRACRVISSLKDASLAFRELYEFLDTVIFQLSFTPIHSKNLFFSTMPTVKPFKGLRVNSESISRVASVPYDVINREEAREMVKDNEDSFLRVVRSDLEFPDSVSPYSDEVYAKAVANLDRLTETGALIEEDEAVFYAYSLSLNGQEQIGIVGLSSVEDYKNGLVKIHEKTRPEKLEDRTRHIVETKTHTGPVLLTYKDHAQIGEILKSTAQSKPLASFTAADGVEHKIWKIEDSASLEKAFLEVDASYIADGHHRAESSRQVFDKLGNTSEGEKASHFLTVLFPESELSILAYNRVVKSIPEGTSKEACIEQLSEVCEKLESGVPTPDKRGEFCVFDGTAWTKYRFKGDLPNDPVSSLDASLLQDLVLAPVFGIGDPRTDANVDFIGGSRGTKELERLVKEGKAAVSFSMHPVTVGELISVADSGKTMPPKSTWFEPKLASGVVSHRFG